MKQCIMIIVCGLLICLMGDISKAKTFEKRVIVPYPTSPESPSIPTPFIEKMPYVQQLPNVGNIHVRPYLNIKPNPYGRGLGTNFGINFGVFRSHGLDFSVNLF